MDTWSHSSSGTVFAAVCRWQRSHVSIHSRPVRRLTPQPTDRGRADRPSLKGEDTEKDFIGSAVLSTSLFPLKGAVSSHKGIFDEGILQRQTETAGCLKIFLMISPISPETSWMTGHSRRQSRLFTERRLFVAGLTERRVRQNT